jgi:predicted RNA-binding protein associated with RNAse of E/G family
MRLSAETTNGARATCNLVYLEIRKQKFKFQKNRGKILDIIKEKHLVF